MAMHRTSDYADDYADDAVSSEIVTVTFGARSNARLESAMARLWNGLHPIDRAAISFIRDGNMDVGVMVNAAGGGHYEEEEAMRYMQSYLEIADAIASPTGYSGSGGCSGGSGGCSGGGSGGCSGGYDGEERLSSHITPCYSQPSQSIPMLGITRRYLPEEKRGGDGREIDARISTTQAFSSMMDGGRVRLPSHR